MVGVVVTRRNDTPPSTGRVGEDAIVAQTSGFEVCGSSLPSRCIPKVQCPAFRSGAVPRELPRQFSNSSWFHGKCRGPHERGSALRASYLHGEVRLCPSARISVGPLQNLRHESRPSCRHRGSLRTNRRGNRRCGSRLPYDRPPCL